MRSDQRDPRKGGLTVSFLCYASTETKMGLAETQMEEALLARTYSGCDFALCTSANCTLHDPVTRTKKVHVPFSAKAPWAGEFNMRVLVDTSVVEVYAMDGRAMSTMLYVPPQPAQTAVWVSSNGDARVNAVVTVFGMGSAYAQ